MSGSQKGEINPVGTAVDIITSDITCIRNSGVFQRLVPGELNYLSINTKDYETVWAELRDDGWRVYRPLKPNESHMDKPFIGTYKSVKKQTKRMP